VKPAAGPALALVGLGGVASAGQSLANAELGARLGAPVLGAVVNNLTALAILAVAAAAWPAMRAGVRALRGAGLPWWAYLGGFGGALFVVGATYAVPVLGVAVFTIAQVAGGSAGGLAVDRVGLGPTGRLALTVPRVAGALLGIGAVAIAQLGRPIGDLALGAVLLAVAGGLGVAIQTALNGRVSRASSTVAGLTVNMVVSSPVVLVIALAAGAFTGLNPWPGDVWLYLGGPLALFVIVTLLIGVQAAGVLRTGLAIVAGQLAGAIVLDLLTPGGPPVGPALLAGSALTFVAVAISGAGARGTATGRRLA
jgi:transporter family-2 protein